jgi:hypothetical protein
MKIVESHIVIAETYGTDGRVEHSREIGPFIDKVVAQTLAKGNGFMGGRDWEVRTTYFLTSDGINGIAFSRPPVMEPIPAEHPLAKVLASVSPSDVQALLKAFGL